MKSRAQNESVLSGEHSSSLGPLLRSDRRTLTCFGIYLLFAAVGAVAIAAAHLGNGPVWGIAYVTAVAASMWPLLFRPVSPLAVRLLRSGVLITVTLLAVAFADQMHFRHAESKSNPLTTALALELPGRALLHGQEPYGVHLPGNAPVSPGPGWILLLLPATAPGLTGLLGMAALGCAAAILWRQDRTAAGLFCLLMLVQPLFESQAANGQDLYVITLALVALSLLLQRHAERPWPMALLGVLAGVIATARMPMLAILFVLALGLFRRNRRAGSVFFCTMLVVTAALDGGFALWAGRRGDWFQPMHVFGRGAFEAGHESQVAVVLLAISAIAWILLKMRDSARDWMLGMWLLMSALFVPEAIKELVLLHFDWKWEGATYFTFALPLLIGVLVLQLPKEQDSSPIRRS